jgi:hypothetical protein
MSTTTYSPLELVDELKSILNIKTDFNFSILAEAHPIKKKYTCVSKILSIITQVNDEKPQTLHYDKILEHELHYLEFKENHMRKVGDRKTPFWIDGSSVIQKYKENEYIEYSLRAPTKVELKKIDKLRIKYQIPFPRIFVGVKLAFDDSDIDDEI